MSAGDRRYPWRLSSSAGGSNGSSIPGRPSPGDEIHGARPGRGGVEGVLMNGMAVVMEDPKTIPPKKGVIFWWGNQWLWDIQIVTIFWETNIYIYIYYIYILYIYIIYILYIYIYIIYISLTYPYFPMIHACSGCLDAQKHCFASTAEYPQTDVDAWLWKIWWLQDLELYSV